MKTMMLHRIIGLVICGLIMRISTTDLFDTKSNTILIQYDGSQQEAIDFGTSLELIFKRKVIKNWYVFTIKPTDNLVAIDVPDIQLTLKKAKKRDKKVKFIEQEEYVVRSKRLLTITDDQWSNQWHLQPNQTPSMNVYNAWEKGYTGKGVTVGVVDDGIDVTHSDLAANYNPAFSYDYIADTQDPSHKHPDDGHGTNCAGIVGAVKNDNCVIGVAYEATLAVIRVVSVNATPSDEVMALTHQLHDVDIYSNSWGPYDDGVTMYTLSAMHDDALELGIKEGRDGKGVIYTFASGNGGYYHDECNADPLVSSMYTIAIAAVDQSGSPTTYSEQCTSIMATTYSGDDYMPNIATTGDNDTCVDDFDGTSAACPMASGIIALTLQANPELTWRDVQHMIVEYSTQSGLSNKTAFYSNGVGKQVSSWCGFGLMNAEAMVDNAPSWLTVPPSTSCNSGALFVDRYTKDANYLSHAYNFTSCHIRYLEHVRVTVDYVSTYRGAVELHLVSPMGTDSIIFNARQNDKSTVGVVYTFMSVHTWGENPLGLWTLTMFDVYGETEMTLYSWKIEMHGTVTDPHLGIPEAGEIGSRCIYSTSCSNITDGGCLSDGDMCVVCNNGYRVVGNRCVQDCPPLLLLDYDMYVNVTNTPEDLVATYGCYFEGYGLSQGDETRTCGTDGIWTGEQPICAIDCGPLEDPDNGHVEFEATTADSQAVYTCKLGYVLTGGDSIRTCDGEGYWDNGTWIYPGLWLGSIAICQIDCGSPEKPRNGYVSVNGTFNGSEAIYKCNEGYSLSVEEVIRTCSSDGYWSLPMPECVIECGLLNNPANGSVYLTTISDGSSVTYTCNKGFSVSGGDMLRLCSIDGIWTGIEPTCDIDCGPLEDPDDGHVTFQATTANSVAVYTCKRGYVLTGGDSVRTCDGDGFWDNTNWIDPGLWLGNRPICQMDCGIPEKPRNGNIAVNGTFSGSEAIYTCNEGYGLSAEEVVRTCSSNGYWSLPPLVCLIECGSLSSPVNGSVFFTTRTAGSSATYTCVKGFNVNDGDSLRACTTDGIWTGIEPTCDIDTEARAEAVSDNVPFILGVGIGVPVALIIMCMIFGVYMKRTPMRGDR